MKWLSDAIGTKIHSSLQVQTLQGPLMSGNAQWSKKAIQKDAFGPFWPSYINMKIYDRSLYVILDFFEVRMRLFQLTVVDTIEGALDFWRPKKLLRRKYLHVKNKLAANFHVIWFIHLLILALLGHPLIYTCLLVVKVLR